MSDDNTGAYLARLASLVATHHPRLLRVLRATLTGGMSPATTEPSAIDSLTELCSFFGIEPELERAGEFGLGNDRMLHGAKCACTRLHASVADFLPWVATHVGAVGEGAAEARADAGASLMVRRCSWLNLVTFVPTVSQWQQAQESALPSGEALPLALRTVLTTLGCGASHTLTEGAKTGGAAAKEQRDSLMDESAFAALQMLCSAKGVLLRTQLLHYLNFFRSVQRHLALSAAGLLSPPPADPAMDAGSECHPRLDPPLPTQTDSTPILAASSAERPACVASPVLPHASAAAGSPTALEHVGGVEHVGGMERVGGVEHVGGVDANDRSQWIGGREVYSTQSVRVAGDDALATASFLCVRDGRGARVLHEQSLSDLDALMTEIAAIALHFERSRASSRAATEGAPKPKRPHAPQSVQGVQQLRSAPEARALPKAGGDKRFDSLSRLGLGLITATCALTRCLTAEVAFQASKAMDRH